MAVPVFKTGVGEELVQVGSIPIRLRHRLCTWGSAPGQADHTRMSELLDRYAPRRPRGTAYVLERSRR